MSLIDDHKAWKSEVDPEDSSKVIQKLRVFLDSIVAEYQPSGLQNAGRHTVVTVNASTWTPLPANALSDRNAIAVQNNTATNVKLNYSNAISGYVGMTIRKNGGERQYDIKDTIILYAKSESGTVNLDVEEIS